MENYSEDRSQPFFHEANGLYKAWETINNKIHNNENFHTQSQEIRGRISQLSLADTRIVDLLQGHNSESARYKRKALLPFVGRISRFLFGTLSDEDLEKMTNLIEVTHNETRKIAGLLAAQTELISTELNITNERINHLEKAVDHIEKQQAEQDALQLAYIAFSLLSDHITKHELDTETLTDAILFATRGATHPQFLDPNILYNSIETVQNTLPDLSFPLQKSDSILQLFDVADTSIAFINFHLIYCIRVPLLDFNSYKLFKITPLPIIQRNLNVSNTFAYIWPASPYVAINSASNTFIFSENSAINKCKTIRKLFICKNTEPIREIQNNAPCEIKIITNQGDINIEECNIKLIHLQESFWVRMHAPNSWAFSTARPEQLFVQCHGRDYKSISIHDTGILQLEQGCAAHTATTRFTASRSISIELPILKFSPNTFNISLHISLLLNSSGLIKTFSQALSGNESLVPITSKDSINMLHLGSSLREITQKARAIQERNLNSNDLESFKFHTTTSGISIISIFAVLLALVGCRYLLAGRRQRIRTQQAQYQEDMRAQAFQILQQAQNLQRRHGFPTNQSLEMLEIPARPNQG